MEVYPKLTHLENQAADRIPFEKETKINKKKQCL